MKAGEIVRMKGHTIKMVVMARDRITHDGRALGDGWLCRWFEGLTVRQDVFPEESLVVDPPR